MNKKELILDIAQRAEVNQVVAERVIDALSASVIATLREGHEFKLTDLGKFSVKTRPARTALNPRTGEKVDVPEKIAVRFKPGKGLIDALQ